ncbi:hypothetical protein [Mesorhizobium loti]|nr:hypothetical protein [Mesorhizobium loti]
MSREQIEAARAYDRLLKRGAQPKGLKAIVAWFKRLWIKFFG